VVLISQLQNIFVLRGAILKQKAAPKYEPAFLRDMV
jgi:hypothetical protein